MSTTLLAISSLGAFTSGSGPVTDYPSENDVRDGVDYDFGTLTGNLVLPAEDDVLLNVGYGSLGTEFVGTLQVPVPPTPVPPTSGGNPFASIAVAIINRLSTALSLDPSFIQPVASDNYPITVDEPFFLVVRFYTITKPRDPALDFENSGAGRLNRPVARRMRVYIYSRTGEDVTGTDTVALFGYDPSQTIDTPSVRPGQFAAEETVLNCLDDWLPVSGDTVPLPLTLGPLHVLDSSEEPQRKPENDAGLVRSCLDFEIVWVSAISPTDPPE